MIFPVFVCVCAIIVGIVLIGSPFAERAKMMDEQRITDLSSIQSQIVYTQWENKGVVPDSLDALNNPISGFSVPVDPETGANYEYNKISSSSFELCANFKTAVSTTTVNTAHISAPAPYASEALDENWQHGIGRVCFARTIDEKLYPVKK